MLETVQFPLGDCPACGPNALLVADLDAGAELVHRCVHCGHPMPPDYAPRHVGARTLALYGYHVDGEIERGGCGPDPTGGCSGGCGV